MRSRVIKKKKKKRKMACTEDWNLLFFRGRFNLAGRLCTGLHKLAPESSGCERDARRHVCVDAGVRFRLAPGQLHKQAWFHMQNSFRYKHVLTTSDRCKCFHTPRNMSLCPAGFHLPLINITTPIYTQYYSLLKNVLILVMLFKWLVTFLSASTV